MALFMAPVKTGVRETGAEDADIWASPIAVSNELSFVSDPGALSPPLASMAPGQASF